MVRCLLLFHDCLPRQAWPLGAVPEELNALGQ